MKNEVHTLSNTKKIITKANAGVGGIRCSCCRAFSSLKASRTLHNRSVRHAAKLELAKIDVQISE